MGKGMNINMREILYVPKKSDEIIDPKKEQKEKLLNKMKENAKKKKVEKTETTSLEKVQSENPNVVKSLKKKKKDLEKKNKSLEKKIDTKNQEKLKLEQQIAQLKKQLFNKETELTNWKNKSIQQEKSISEMKIIIEKQEVKINESKDSNIKEQQKQIKREISKVRKDNSTLTVKNHSLKVENNRLKQKLTTVNTINREEFLNRNQQLQSMLSDRDTKIRNLETKVKELEESIPMGTCLKVLKNNVAKLDKVSIELLQTIIREFNLNQGKKKSKGSSKKKKNSNQPNFEDYKMGYVIKKDNQWWFVDLENKMFEIIENGYQLKNDNPVRVMINPQNKAVVNKAYPLEKQITTLQEYQDRKRFELKKQKKENLPMVDVAPIGNFPVLIVGSRNISEYKNRLLKTGLKVETYDSYEENPRVLSGKYSSAKIVIVCTSHTSHEALNHINKNDDKVELIERDNAETIEARIRFAANRLGLRN